MYEHWSEVTCRRLGLQMLRISLKIAKESPSGSILWTKCQNLMVLGAGIPTFLPRQTWIKFDTWNLAALDRDKSTKFGLQLDFVFWKTATATNTKPVIALSRRDCHHVIYSSTIGPIWMKYGSLMQNNMPISVVEVKTERKIFNMADVCFSKPEILVSQPCIGLYRPNTISW